MKTPFDPSNDRIQVNMNVTLFLVLKQKQNMAIKLGFHRTEPSVVFRVDMMLLVERQRANTSDR